MPTDKTTEVTVEQAQAFIDKIGNCGLYPDKAQAHISALCATVRHLLSENEKLKSLAAEALREIPQTRDTQATRVRVNRELEQL